MPHLQELVDSTRSYIDETTAAYWTDAEIVRFLNRGQEHVIQKAIEAYQDYFLTTADFSIVSGTDIYSLPQNAMKIRRIERIYPNDTTQIPIAWQPIVLSQKGQYDSRTLGFANSQNDEFYILRANDIQVVPVPGSAAAGTLNGRFWYIPRIGDLQSGTATGGAASTITFPSTPTQGLTSRRVSYYLGSNILITGGTGIGQFNNITAYDGVNRIATVGTAWLINPDATSTYSIVSPIPEEYQYLFVLYAAIQAYLKEEADAGQLEKEFNRLMAQFIVSIQDRQSQESRSVRFFQDEDYIY